MLKWMRGEGAQEEAANGGSRGGTAVKPVSVYMYVWNHRYVINTIRSTTA